MHYSRLVRYCKTLPHAEWERKWGNTLTFLVARKMFALFILDDKDRPSDLWCKVDDDVFLSLTGQPGIRPAPYLARAKWIAMAPEAMTDAMAQQTLRRAHELILMKLPKRVRQELHAQHE